MDSPTRPFASGRDCEVVALADGRVARSYRDGRSARAEFELVTALHALGYPVPRVDHWRGPTLVMERIDGSTLGAQILSGAVPLGEGAATWVALQERLHRVPWPGGESLIHGDFHPFNVMLGPHGPVVIDWTNAAPGPPGVDIALSALVLAGVALTGEVPGAEEMLAAYAGAVTTPYLGFLPRAAALRTAKPHTTPDEIRVMDRAVELVRAVAAAA